MRNGKRILISGSTGLIGSTLVDFLVRKGHSPLRLVRKPGVFNEKYVLWDIKKHQLNPTDLESLDVVIHLAGESIMGRWTDEKKDSIVRSRVEGTRLLSETISQMANPPEAFICASAVGYYGNRGDEILTEVSSRGEGFLAHTCEQWEKACLPAAAKGVRVVNTRFGMVLSPEGGALKVMYWPFRLGFAGELGNGKQYMSWMALEDIVGGLYHVINTPSLRGPVNFVAPMSVRNSEFTKTLREKLVPKILPMHYWTPPAPAIVIKALMGEMGQELLLASQHVEPVRLVESGYQFKYPTLKGALDSML